MNFNKNSSLLVILISASQLILILLLVGFIFQGSQAEGVHQIQKTAFASFLLVGLIGFCVTVLLLRRYDNHLLEIKHSLEDKVESRTGELLTTQKAVIYGLAKLAESRDNDTGDHLARIQLYVTILAKSLRKHHPEIDDEFIKNLTLASSLHDIGKVGVPDAILLKQGRLTSAERGIMELHTVIGGDCLSSIQSQLGGNDFLEMAREIAYYHHERWDGTGYPRGRKEETIPLCARIVSVADVYDALRTKRPYKQPIPHLESRGIILGGTGTQFDPEVVNAFLENENEFERISAECSRMTAEEVTPKIKILSEMLIEK
jgi:putative two-component system response regulator